MRSSVDWSDARQGPRSGTSGMGLIEVTAGRTGGIKVLFSGLDPDLVTLDAAGYPVCNRPRLCLRRYYYVAKWNSTVGK